MAQSSDSEDSENNAKNVDTPQLPIEIITHLISYLSFSDRLTVRLVNRTWREASLAKKFIDREVIWIGQLPMNNTNKVLDMLENSTRLFYHVVFTQVELVRSMPIWDQHGPHLRSLTLSACDISEKILVDILNCCTSLQMLHIDNCQNFLISGRLLEDESSIEQLSKRFQHLHELKLTYNRFLSDVLFNRLVAICPNLSSLCVTGCQVSFHPGLYKKFYPQNSTTVPEASKSVLTFMNMFRYLEKQATKLKSLDLSSTFVDANALNTLCALQGLKLETLLLENCQQLSLAGVRGLTQHQIWLKVLDLTKCVRITDASLICICQNLRDLEVLKLERCRAITDVGVQHIRKLRQLKHLNISSCERLTGRCITRGICLDVPSELEDMIENDDPDPGNIILDDLYGVEEPPVEGKIIENRNLTVLSANCVNLSEESIEYICRSFPNLTSLEVNYCINGVTDKTIQMIFKELVKLRTLKFYGCDRITDAGMTGMTFNSEKNIEGIQTDNFGEQSESRLRISLRSRAEEEIVRDAARKREVLKLRAEISKSSSLDVQPGCPASRLKGLRVLDLSHCTRITDDSLKYAFEFPELRTVDFGHCDQITDIGLDYLTRNNPAIEELNLMSCSRITDTGMSYVARKLHRLKRLDIMGCFQLTDCTLRELALYCKSLQYLDARQCIKLTSQGFENLRQVYIERTKFVDEVTLEDIVPAPKPPAMPAHSLFRLS